MARVRRGTADAASVCGPALRAATTMPSLPLRLHVLLLLGALSACARAPRDRALEACQAEIVRHLVNPASARYTPVRVERRFGDGARVVDGWDVQISVEARAGNGQMARSTVVCTLGLDFELLDLSGEQHVPET